MDEDTLRKLLDDVRGGRVAVDGAIDALKSLPFRALEDATLDTHRTLRQGLPEVVFAQGKSVPQVVDVACSLLASDGAVLATRVSGEQAEALARAIPEGAFDAMSRTFRAGALPPTPRIGPVTVVSAGTADLPVAEEAAVTAAFLGNEVRRIRDVGVAGLHRIAARRAELDAAAVLVVVAGMEGALPGVVAGLVSRPVIAVPTSVGYGASFGGLSALLTMLNTCAAGVGVVNIDNGFGAAVLATFITRLHGRPPVAEVGG